MKLNSLLAGALLLACTAVFGQTKTGYVDQSGSCAASFQRSNSGTNYVCVTVNAHSPWRCIYDHVAIYRDLAP